MEKSLPIIDRALIATLFLFVMFSIFSISVTQIASGIGGFLWLLRTHLTGTWKNQRFPLGIPFLLFVLACLIAVIDAYDISYSYPSLKKLLEFLIFFWVINCVKENRLRDQLLLVLIASATLAGLFGAYQAWETTPMEFTRAEGTLSTYMTFSGILMMVGLLALARFLYGHPKEIWLLPCLGVILACLFFTLTRQAWLGFLVGGIFLVYTKKWKTCLILIISICVLVFVFKDSISSKVRDVGLMIEEKPEMLMNTHFTHSLISRIRSTLEAPVSGTFRQRVSLWKGGWEIFKDHPLTGCGFRCVDKLYSKYPDPTGLIKRLRGMHNNYIQLAVDTGVLGLFTWCGIWFYFFLMLYKRLVALDGDPNEKGIILGSAAGSIAFLTGGFFETNLYDSEVAMTLYFLMALPFSGSQNNTGIATKIK
jgi:O-antigen ligase